MPAPTPFAGDAPLADERISDSWHSCSQPWSDRKIGDPGCKCSAQVSCLPHARCATVNNIGRGNAASRGTFRVDVTAYHATLASGWRLPLVDSLLHVTRFDQRSQRQKKLRGSKPELRMSTRAICQVIMVRSGRRKTESEPFSIFAVCPY